MSDVQQRIDDLVKNNRVMLFMKGNAQFPQCGFSGRAIQVLKAAGATGVKTFNVLEDDEVRQGVKEFSNWPTVPQLYINGEFIGGSDIMMEMYEAGELQQDGCGHGRTPCRSWVMAASITTRVGPRSVPIHSPNSSAFEIVADRHTTETASGRWMSTSSQTAPRDRSAR